MKVVAIAAARMGSTRVPGKVMRILGDKPVLRWTVDALSEVDSIDEIVLATSTDASDDCIIQYTDSCPPWLLRFRGSPTDVLDRYYQCALLHKAAIIVRVTCDCPFLDPRVIEEVIRLREMSNASYASNIDPPSYPDGLDVEVFTFPALEAAWREATSPVDRDCLPQFISRNRHKFPAANLHCPLPGLASERWVLDTEEDWTFCETLVRKLPHLGPPSYLTILSILDAEPGLRRINSKWGRNERFYQGLAAEPLCPRSFTASDHALSRALKTIPFGAQTFSKSHIQFPSGRAPLYCSHGDGGYIFDLDGNRYVDLVNAVLPVVLGYRDPDVDEAIRRQLDNGISFSLGTTLEAELSELLYHYVPCAEMCKFGKSGTDVTTAAVRLARAYTGRKHVLLSGYHGWSDWSMACTDRNLGIPQEVRDLSHRFEYGNQEQVTRLTDRLDVAAIIVEPSENMYFLEWLRRVCDNEGIILIFDEIITGFRYGMGGAQELYNVTPDLATFGKAMANGMPISALVGRRPLMKMMQPPGNIFYSGTMFGETLSIAAAIATIKKLDSAHVINHLWNVGADISQRVNQLISDHKLRPWVRIGGVPCRTVLSFTEDTFRTIFMAQMAQEGVLIINSNNVSFGHQVPEVQRILTAYENTLGLIRLAIDEGSIEERAGKVVSAAPLRATA